MVHTGEHPIKPEWGWSLTLSVKGTFSSSTSSIFYVQFRFSSFLTKMSFQLFKK